jgi:hypothetical protein
LDCCQKEFISLESDLLLCTGSKIFPRAVF